MFSRDAAVGDKGEATVRQLFEGCGATCTKVPFETKSHYDLSVDLEGTKFSVEVKLDKMYSVTGNIAIEFYNPLRGEDSGIGATKADLWAHLVYNKKTLEVWVTDVKALKEYIDNNKPFKVISVGGDQNASLYLYKGYVLEDLFIRVDELDCNQLKEVIFGLLD